MAKTKLASIIVVHSGFRQISKQVSDKSEYTGIGSWTRSWCAANWRLVYYNYFINKIRGLRTQMDNFAGDFLNIVKRNFLAN